MRLPLHLTTFLLGTSLHAQATKQRLQNKGTVTGGGGGMPSAAGAAAAAAAALASITGRKRPAEDGPLEADGQKDKDAEAGTGLAGTTMAEPMDEGA